MEDGGPGGEWRWWGTYLALPVLLSFLSSFPPLFLHEFPWEIGPYFKCQFWVVARIQSPMQHNIFRYPFRRHWIASFALQRCGWQADGHTQTSPSMSWLMSDGHVYPTSTLLASPLWHFQMHSFETICGHTRSIHYH